MPRVRAIVRVAALVAAASALLAGFVWPSTRIALSEAAVALLLASLATFIDPGLAPYHPRHLAIAIVAFVFAAAGIGYHVWREGEEVAAATFDPGIAPFRLTVREVPVPVTRSHHFIVTLKRGQYAVTSFRFFWVRYTPRTVRIEWTRLESFRVIFDERYVAQCDWSWGKSATWTMQVPAGGMHPGDRP